MTQAGPDDGDSLDVDRIARTVRPTFGRRVVAVPPGEAMPFDPSTWADAIVFVLAGEIDVQCSSGAGHRFQQGDILWFTGLSVRALRNGGSVPVRLLAIWRIAHR
jgi:quercetin dioxygenase-like cupin family protein